MFQVFPRKRLVLAVLVPAGLTLGLLAFEGMLPAVIVLDVVLVLVLAGDLATLPSSKTFSAERESGRVVSLGKPHPVVLTVNNHAQRWFDVSARDAVPHLLNPEPDEFDVRLARRSRTVLRYELRAGRRGSFTIERVHLRVQSRAGFWQRLLAYPVETVLHVYPDMQQLGQYALLARTDRLNLLGVRHTRRIGQDHRVRAAPRLHDRRQLQAHRLAKYRPTAQADGQGLSSLPVAADPVPHRLRSDDDQRGGRTVACWTTGLTQC